jgi:predicted PhzF superfamily epimerase YddE/YHI9
MGVNEDPVTGSAHCQLSPFWGDRLGVTEMTALQLSERGGELDCQLKGDRVVLSGRCVLFAEGRLYLPAAV